MHLQSPQLQLLPLLGGASHHDALSSNAGLPRLQQRWVLQSLKALDCSHSLPSPHAACTVPQS